MHACVTPVAFMHTDLAATVCAMDVAAAPGLTEERTGRFFGVRVLLDENELPLRPGMTVLVALMVTELENSIAVPFDAVFEEDGEMVCYVFEHNAPRRQPVELGPNNGLFWAVTSGLEDGQQVCVHPPTVRASGRPQK